MSERASLALLRYRRPLVVVAHWLIWSMAYFGAFGIRFDFNVDAKYWSSTYLVWLAVLLVLRTLVYSHYGLFQGLWRYTGQRDLIDIGKATTITTGLWVVLMMGIGMRSFPRGVIAVEFMLTVALVGGVRFANRTFAQATRRVHEAEVRTMLIVGAGDAGEALLREVQRSMDGRIHTVGFLDDDPRKRGTNIHGVPILGALDQAKELLETYEVDEVAIAMPTATGDQMRRVIGALGTSATVRTIPGLDHLIDGQVSVNQLRDVAIEDLLGRDPVQLDTQLLLGMVRNEVVLVTGAGGSIGSELCRQVLKYRPSTVVLVEQSENALYHIHRELSRLKVDVDLQPRIVDITDPQRLDRVFLEFKPGIVLHAAAYKHVPMMEWNPSEALKNNIGGTRCVADAAHRHEVRRFVMISTDKAVNPTSVMGCTKRIAELYVQSQAERSTTKFATVRFGNVLGSNGSVIPLFRDQIAHGGPVTVTDPEMTRYFMTIPEASQLVLQSAAMAESGQVFVLDMGEPVKIVDLARDLIRLSGFTPGEDIQIEFIGMRPGEKLFEELSADAENATKTKHPKIFIGRGKPLPHGQIRDAIDTLLTDVETASAPAIRAALKRVVPEFCSPEDATNVVELHPSGRDAGSTVTG